MQDQPTLRGFCECGCGELTSIAPQTKRAFGHVKGQPVRFRPGHANRRTPHAYEVRDCGYETPCWVWIRYVDKVGYGRMNRDGRMRLAYLIMWTDAHGPVPEGRELDHLCRNKACVNPEHLEPVTHAENMRRGKRVILTAGDVRAIRASNESHAKLAARYGVARATITNARTGKHWANL